VHVAARTARRRAPHPLLLVAALLTAALTLFELLPPRPAGAQSPPAVYYGRGLRPGATVEALIRGAVCARSPVDDRGEWALTIAPFASCGPRDGDTTSFKVDGQTAPLTAPFRSGYTPPDTANGLVLGIAGGSSTPGAGGSGGAASGPRMVGGSVPRGGGFGLVVFSGGSGAQLVQASGCPSATATFWATAPGGEFVIYLPAAAVVELNARWHALFPTGIPANQPLLAKCQ
jgi:hypothetical protein